MLLRAIVQVAFDPATLLVLGGDEALPGRAKVIEPRQQLPVQADVLQHQASLAGEIRDQLLLDDVHGLASLLVDGERAQQLTPVADRDHRVAMHVGYGAVLHHQRRERLGRLR